MRTNRGAYVAIFVVASLIAAGVYYLAQPRAEVVRARADEAYESRIWAGIHFRHEMVVGKAIGVAVGQKVIEHAQQDGAMASR